MKLRGMLAVLSTLVLSSLGFSLDPHALGISFTGDIYNINLASGSGVFLGSSGLSSTNCMGRINDSYYTIDGNGDMYRIGASSGAVFVYHLALGGKTNVRGFAVDASNKYYLAVDGGAGNDQLWTFDNATGVGTFIATMTNSSIQGLAMSVDGRLFAYSVATTNAGGLLVVDPVTGVTTDTDPNSPGTPNIQDITPSSFDFYGANNSVFSIDQHGVETLIGTGAYSNIRGLSRRVHPANLNTMTLKLGALKSGNIESLRYKDGQKAVFAKAFVPNLTVDPVNIELTFGLSLAPTDVEEFSLAMLGRMLTAGAFLMSLDAKNVVTNQFDAISVSHFETTEVLPIARLNVNPQNYIAADKSCVFRVRIRASGFVASPAWSAELDMARTQVYGHFQ